jgi:hypothetical protein
VRRDGSAYTNGADGWLAEARRVSLFRDRDEGLAVDHHVPTTNYSPSPYMPMRTCASYGMLVIYFFVLFGVNLTAIGEICYAFLGEAGSETGYSYPTARLNKQV